MMHSLLTPDQNSRTKVIKITKIFVKYNLTEKKFLERIIKTTNMFPVTPTRNIEEYANPSPATTQVSMI